jgi:hypothetical protein
MALSTMMMPIMMMILLTAGVDLVPPAWYNLSLLSSKRLYGYIYSLEILGKGK